MGDGQLLFHRFGMMKKFWKWIVVIVAQHCECLNSMVCVSDSPVPNSLRPH